MKKVFLGVQTKEISKRELAHADLARHVAEEGIVLLKNEGVLPLNSKHIALFGNGVRKPSKGGTGSGDVNSRYLTNIEMALEQKDYIIETKSYLDDFDQYYQTIYDKWFKYHSTAIEGITDFQKIVAKVVEVPFHQPTAISLTDEHLKHISADTALYILTRQAGEGNDRTLEQGDYYLTDIEIQNFTKINKHFNHCIVIINSGSVVDLTPLDEFSSIKAILFAGQGGAELGNAIVNIISGVTTPSGKLTSTWSKLYEDYPNALTYSHLSGDTTQEDYIEDIYIGYRYFDSFNIDVRYPFGYGLSYTTFAISNVEVTLQDGLCFVSGTIRNTGNYPGKEVIQVYVSLPNGEIHHEYQRLVGFTKTKHIEIGETTSFTVIFNISQRCTVYNEKTSSYELLLGEYIIRAGTSSQNNQAVGILTIPEKITVERCVSIVPRNRDFSTISTDSFEFESTLDLQRIKFDSNSIKTIQSDYDKLDGFEDDEINTLLEKLSISEMAELVVGGGTRGESIVQVLGSTSTTSSLYENHGIPSIVTCDGPAGLKVIPEVVALPTGQYVSVNHVAGKGNWMDLLIPLLPQIPEYSGELHCFYATAFPVATVQAQTWNLDLITDIGRAIAIEMEEFGVTVWLAPGMNIQRNPLCGRNFEYYSEDPFVSGKMAAAVTNGVQEKSGLAVSIKHYVANNQEDNRNHSSSNMSERALREIYLKGFEITVKEAKPKTVMSSYNLVNGIYTPNSYDLLTTVLRQEWGFNGVVMTDWGSCDSGRGNPSLAIKSGNDLIMPGSIENTKSICESVNNNSLDLIDLKRSAYRLLKLIQSNRFVHLQY